MKRKIKMKVKNLIGDGHLGGFVEGGDPGSYYPEVWDKLIKDFEIKSVIDVGCGEGHAAKYFHDKGCTVFAIDGSKKVLENAVIDNIIINDYTKGKLESWIKDVDLVWCCEFVEHVEEEFLANILDTFTRAGVVVMTHALPGQGGHHHVNEQEDEYWIRKMREIGFVCDWIKTLEYRELAHDYFQKSGLVFVLCR